MDYKIRTLTGASLLLIMCSVFASPQSCPNLADIQAEGLHIAEQMSMNVYLSYHLSNYHTSSNWGFVLAPVEAKSEELSLEYANTILNSMSAPGIPYEDRGLTICDYNTGNHKVMAAAVENKGHLNMPKIKQLIVFN